jgi:hypothetical protein
LAALLVAGGVVCFAALLPVGDYSPHSARHYTTGWVADLMVRAVVLAPLGAGLLLAAALLLKRANRLGRRRR